jgi:pilus assembly protein CpaF
VITLQDIYEFKLESIGFDRTIVGGLQPTGLRPVLLQKFEKRGIELPTDMFVQAPLLDGSRVAR